MVVGIRKCVAAGTQEFVTGVESDGGGVAESENYNSLCVYYFLAHLFESFGVENFFCHFERAVNVVANLVVYFLHGVVGGDFGADRCGVVLLSKRDFKLLITAEAEPLGKSHDGCLAAAAPFRKVYDGERKNFSRIFEQPVGNSLFRFSHFII